MRSKICFLICCCICMLWRCTNEQIEKLQQREDLNLVYNGNNILGKTFIEDLNNKNDGKSELKRLLGDSRTLMLDFTLQGCNVNDGCFYAIPICDKTHHITEAYLLATLNNEEKDIEGLDQLTIVDQESLQSSSKQNQYESYFLMWNSIGLNIKPELYSIAKKLNEDHFVGISRTGQYYQTYDYNANYRWDYSKLIIPTFERVTSGTVSLIFREIIVAMQMMTGIDPVYTVRADTTFLHVSFYAPMYSYDEIKALTDTFKDQLREHVDHESMLTFMGITYKYFNSKLTGNIALPDPDPDPDPDPEYPVYPWEPIMPEDNQLEIHRCLLNVAFNRMPKVFRDSLFKGDSLADSRVNRSVGKSYIHALMELGQTEEQTLSDMRLFFIDQMELFFETGNAVNLAMALHPIIDSYCLGHEKRYWMNEEWYYDVIHRFEGKFIFYNDDSAVIKALEDIYQSVIVNGQRDLNTIFNAWLYSFSYGPLNSSNIIN